MKTRLIKNQLDKIIELFNQDIGSRKIAEIIGVNRSTIQAAYKQLNLDSASKKTPRFAYKALSKCCKKCNQIKDIIYFRKRINNKTNRISFETYCQNCEFIYLNEKSKRRAKILRQSDPNFVIRKSVSYFIWKSLKQSKSSKNGESCLDYLEYTIEELKIHLEFLFEPWMNWDNHGNYKKSIWKDNDQSTWTWQIDHIIPQSKLPYTSMKDDNFKKCWALDNLRPLNSKQNILDGTSKKKA
jgi:hypothetical protein